MQEYNICYSLDSHYTEQLAVSITSILKNADISDNINFYILDGGLTVEDKFKIEILKNIKNFNVQYILVDEKEFKTCPLLVEKDETRSDYHVTLPTYFRFKLAEFLPNLTKVLYLDCDVIVRASLKELFDINIDDKAVALVLDADTEKESKRLSLKQYFNAGVMLINLDYWRKNDVENRLFEYAQNNQDIILWQDQDIVNVVLKNEIKELDKSWNYQYFQYEQIDNKELGAISILHLAGRFKPWLMPFESCVYDEYYYYLLATSWKSNILKYKQDSAGKYLKNQTGGSVTNILVNATDEDIQKCCSSIDENYIFVKEQFDVVEKKTDEKLSNIYDKLVESNEFVKELDKETRYLLQKEIDEKTTDLYNEIANSNEFVKELDKETRYLLEKSTNEKVDLVYEEITRNYKYTEKLVDETKESLSNLKGEIDRNNSYVECLVEISEDKQSQKINEITEIINKKLQDTQTRVLELEKSKEVIFTEEQEKVLNEIVNENIIDVKTELNKETSHRYSELYSYSNEHFSTLYKGLKDTAFNFETILNDKVSNLYQNDENIKWEVNTIKENLTASFALVNTVKELKQELLEQKNNSNQKFIELQKEYEDRLNKQRIKYEKKLMKLEESIKEDKKNPIVKLIEKIKKR